MGTQVSSKGVGMKGEELKFELPRTHAELAALRMLVESMLMALPPDIRADALQRFSNQCARLTSDLQSAEMKDALVNVMEVAIAQQMRRFARSGLEVPQPAGDLQAPDGPAGPQR